MTDPGADTGEAGSFVEIGGTVQVLVVDEQDPLSGEMKAHSVYYIRTPSGERFRLEPYENTPRHFLRAGAKVRVTGLPVGKRLLYREITTLEEKR